MSGDADESKRRKTKGNGDAAGSEGLPGPSTVGQAATSGTGGTPTQTGQRPQGRPGTPVPQQQPLAEAGSGQVF